MLFQKMQMSVSVVVHALWNIMQPLTINTKVTCLKNMIMAVVIRLLMAIIVWICVVTLIFSWLKQLCWKQIFQVHMAWKWDRVLLTSTTFGVVPIPLLLMCFIPNTQMALGVMILLTMPTTQLPSWLWPDRIPVLQPVWLRTLRWNRN